MHVNIDQKVGARFKMIVRKASNDSTSSESGWFNNLVLDSGLNRMSVGTWIDRCCVGTSNNTPLATQTSLGGFVASTTTKKSTTGSRNTSTTPYYWSSTVTWSFATGVATGNLSEVGLGWADTNLWNRALILDSSGNPTTITVLADEYLDVIAEVRIYPADNFSGSFNRLDKTGAVIGTHTYTGRCLMLSDGGFHAGVTTVGMNGAAGGACGLFSGAINSITAIPSENIGYYGSTRVTNTYPTARSITAVITLVPADAVATHQTITMCHGSCLMSPSNNPNGYQIQISPAIVKTSLQSMTYTFSFSWSRYTP